MTGSLRSFGRARIAVVLIGAALGSLGLSIYYVITAQLGALDARMLAASRLELELEREIGYGGLIHNFKNYVLRGSANYRDAAERNAQEVGRLLSELEQLLPDAARDDFSTLRATTAQYETNIAVATAARRRGLDAEEIDRLVKVDDSQALRVLAHWMRECLDRIEAERRALNDAHAGVIAALLLWLAASVVLHFMVLRWMVEDRQGAAGGA
jgi:hypothetical protein